MPSKLRMIGLVSLLAQVSAFTASAQITGEGPCPNFGHSYVDERQRRAVLFGPEYQVPALRFRFVDLETGLPARPSLMRLFYTWDELKGGQWDGGIERFHCKPESNEFTVPAYTVKPWSSERHWNSSLPWMKPKFERLEVAIHREGLCDRTLLLYRGQMSRVRDSTLIVKLTCAGLPEVWIEAEDGSLTKVSRDSSEW